MCRGMSCRQGNTSQMVDEYTTHCGLTKTMFVYKAYEGGEAGVTGRFGNWTWGTNGTKELLATKRADCCKRRCRQDRRRTSLRYLSQVAQF